MNNRLLFSFIGALTLGLAPFFPEPHVWGKLKWILGGANGMKLIDFFDFLLHGSMWIWFSFELFRFFKIKK